MKRPWIQVVTRGHGDDDLFWVVYWRRRTRYDSILRGDWRPLASFADRTSAWQYARIIRAAGWPWPMRALESLYWKSKK